jgi:hypothetical protein
MDLLEPLNKIKSDTVNLRDYIDRYCMSDAISSPGFLVNMYGFVSELGLIINNIDVLIRQYKIIENGGNLNEGKCFLAKGGDKIEG